MIVRVTQGTPGNNKGTPGRNKGTPEGNEGMAGHP